MQMKSLRPHLNGRKVAEQGDLWRVILVMHVSSYFGVFRRRFDFPLLKKAETNISTSPSMTPKIWFRNDESARDTCRRDFHCCGKASSATAIVAQFVGVFAVAAGITIFAKILQISL